MKFPTLPPYWYPDTQKGPDRCRALRLSKRALPFLTKGLQSAARTICTPLAYKSHTCSLSCIFCQVQEVNCPEGARETTLGCAPTENDQNLFAACGRQTLRGFFDTLERQCRHRHWRFFAVRPYLPFCFRLNLRHLWRSLSGTSRSCPSGCGQGFRCLHHPRLRK